jgi:hypothetical protein
VPFEEIAGCGLAELLLQSQSLPKTLLIYDCRLNTVLGPFCETLGIDLRFSEHLPFLTEVMETLESAMQRRR